MEAIKTLKYLTAQREEDVRSILPQKNTDGYISFNLFFIVKSSQIFITSRLDTPNLQFINVSQSFLLEKYRMKI
jgi:hypothetical protein